MKNFITAEEFLKLPKEVQNEIVSWWKPSIGDLFAWNEEANSQYMHEVNCCSSVNIVDITTKNKGIEFNSTREKIGIPLIGKNWEINDSRYRTIWSNVDSTDRHFRKTIEYGILNAKTETDYYQNKKREGTFAWSVYNYGNNSFEYYLEKPNEKLVSVNEKGNLKYENPTIEKKVNKTEFEKYITE